MFRFPMPINELAQTGPGACRALPNVPLYSVPCRVAGPAVFLCGSRS